MFKQKLVKNKAVSLLQLGLLIAPVATSVVGATVLKPQAAKAETTGTGASREWYNNNAGGVLMEGMSPSGYYQYCLNAGVIAADGTQYSAPTQLSEAGRIVALGINKPGYKSPYREKTGSNISDNDLAGATQLAVWISLGQGGWPEGYNRLPVNTKYARATQQVKDAVKWLLANKNTALNNTGVDLTGAETSMKSSLQNEANTEAQAKVNEWASSKQNDLQNKVNSQANSQLSSFTSSAKGTASKLIHFTQDKPTQDKVTIGKGGSLTDGDKNNHSDNYELGSHVWDFTLKHDDPSTLGKHVSNVNFGTGADVKFDKALPSGSVIINNGKTITTDGSKSKTYHFNYGKIQIQVPFSDQPSEATAKMTGTEKITGHVKTDSFSQSASSQVEISKSGTVSGEGVNYTQMQAVRTGYQTFLVVVDSKVTKSANVDNVKASAAKTVTASAATQGDFNQTISQDLSMKWNSMLTDFYITKTDETGTKLRGVTFELVQDSVKNSQVLKTGPGNYTLAGSDGDMISLPKITNSKDGRVVWKSLPYGKYMLLEVQNDGHHVLNSSPIELTANRFHVGKQMITVINNKDGSLKVKSQADFKQTPTIHTTATGTNGTKMVLGAGVQKITDTVTYTGLKPNTTYHMFGQFVDQATGKKIDGLNGNTKFTTPKAKNGSVNGTVQVHFSADASKFAGKTIVAFETLYPDNGKGKPKDSVIATHANIKDSGQTLTVTKPEIHTTATADGKKVITPDGKVHVTDVVAYKGLIPGATYTITGNMVNSDSAKQISDNKVVTFKPTATDGTVNVDMVVDASQMGKKGMTAFETLTDDQKQTVAVHKDVNDKGQTITPEVPVKGQGKSPTPTASLAETATNNVENNFSLFILGGAVTLMLAGGISMAKKKQ